MSPVTSVIDPSPPSEPMPVPGTVPDQRPPPEIDPSPSPVEVPSEPPITVPDPTPQPPIVA